MDKTKRIKELISILREASDAYYNKDTEIMSDYQYDALFDELVTLEAKTGLVLPNSPTQNTGIEVGSKLKTTIHEFTALSLDKTKDIDKLVSWLGDRAGCLSWKMDGLTIIATYEKGMLKLVETRGNGIEGEDVTFNSKNFKGLPQRIKYKGKLIVRGEAIMTFKEFEKINNDLPPSAKRYKNPRNLASATVRLTDANVAADREIIFYAFSIVYSDDSNHSISMTSSLDWMQRNGFNVVQHFIVTSKTLSEKIESLKKEVLLNDFPADGLVLVYDDIVYGKSLGSTGHHERSGMAFKWADETAETILTDIEWSASRTGLLNPVAIFEPVELEGTTVSRASVHNVSIMRSLSLSIGSKIAVYKANMIIPQIAKNVKNNGPAVIPDTCPICGAKTTIEINDDVETLYCPNENCPAKKVGKFTYFCSRNAMDIEGMSEATLEKFISNGFLADFRDIYHLDKFRDKIVLMEGFGEKSYENLINAIEESRDCKFSSLLAALSIPGVGKEMARVISIHLGDSPAEKFLNTETENIDYSCVQGIGKVINKNIHEWFTEENKEILSDLIYSELNCKSDVVSSVINPLIGGKVFVVTGSLDHFANRDELKTSIEKNGGKVTGGVTSKTDFLINNDSMSSSSKNKKAKELGVKIITEKEYLEMLGE